ncbi:hypothetical protein A3A79_00045 [Candidatus Gottesmanbacteria bacterium RIFCSPLOWO2_01_FULL_43_11b]|uniref:SIS domain-containing protein n=1 Tax=Candidatus Gottesmanbacteria bacterium RIFCSPLOWO2_01_FULL_43_11b TaxID=1798392 RepID=A0A1F6AFS6_9BACT|nr:MAG: hypothetical protein A3A79_00045 [Candidatus Gottesmanbacteria bacterium RIFCSPLOWO2_01_FULL_43_11b]
MNELDSANVLGSTMLFPDQCEQAWTESSSLSFGDRYKNIYNIVVCGMGGSRFPPKTIKELFRDRIKEPYEIVEDYTLPSYVDSDTLVILSSYSGTTEEVISCANDAIKRGSRITGVTSGGQIAQILREHTGYVFTPKHNPSDQPRIGGGYLLMGHIGLLKALNLLEIDSSEVEEAIKFIREQTSNIQSKAKDLAKELKDKHTFIITSEFLKGFGNGFGNQLNETAKIISDPRNIPELNHHLMEGLKYPDTLHTNGLFLFFVSDLYSAQVQKRYRVTEEVVKKQNIQTLNVVLTGKTKLSQALEAYTLSGFTSFYLAMFNNLDPSKIPWVDYFKKELAKD